MEAATVTLGVIALTALAAWIGEAAVLNFIILPGIKALDEEGRAAFISRYLPRFFHMATVLALTAVLSGLAARALGSFSLEVSIPVLSGGSPAVIIALILIAALTCFHLAAQARMRPVAKSLSVSPNSEKLRSLTRFLSIVPRIGLGVIVAAFVLLTAELLSG